MTIGMTTVYTATMNAYESEYEQCAKPPYDLLE